MTYMGGKQRLAPNIVPILNNYIKENGIENFYDVMCGGANIISGVECNKLYANDLSPTLIALHQAAQQDFSSICTDSSREQWDRCYGEYKKLKSANFKKESSIPLAEIGAIEWFGGFSGRGFPGGYAVLSQGRNQFKERYNNLKKQSQSPSYSKIHFTCGDYRDLEFKPNSLIYCDGPYRGTKTYGISTKFVYSDYYKWLMRTAKTTPIFISEQELPLEIPASIIWQKGVKRDIDPAKNKTEKIEKLFFLDLREE